MAKLELAILVGAESKEWLAKLENVVERLEDAVAASGGKGSKKPAAVIEDDEPEADEDDELPKAKVKGGKKKPAIDDDEAGEAPDEDDEDEPAPKKKTTKKKGPTIDDVHDACQLKAKSLGKGGRDAVLKILTKKFKVESVSELDEDDYQDVIDAMAVEED